MTIRIGPPTTPLPADGGAPRVPTSKSHAQRALCLNAFTPRPTELRDLPPARDVAVLAAALESWRSDPHRPLFLRDNGTGMRVLSVLLPMLGESCLLDGTPRLRERPLTATEEFWRRYGGRVGWEWPRRCSAVGVTWPREVVVDARLTTQVASGVLLGAGLLFAQAHSQPDRASSGPRLVRVEAPAAGGYLGITRGVLAEFGIRTALREEGEDWIVEFREYAPDDVRSPLVIPPDASSYTFFAGVVAAHGHPVPTPDSAVPDGHPDWAALEDLRLLSQGPGDQPVEILDLGTRPDAFPCLAALAALRPGPTVLRGAPSLRHKESDRIQAMVSVLRGVGAECEEFHDGIRVRKPMPEARQAVVLPTPDDHRIVMAAALLGTRQPGEVVLEHPDAVAKSWPGFFDWLCDLGCRRAAARE